MNSWEKSFFIATAIFIFMMATGFACHVGYMISYDKAIRNIEGEINSQVMERTKTLTETIEAYKKAYGSRPY